MAAEEEPVMAADSMAGGGRKKQDGHEDAGRRRDGRPQTLPRDNGPDREQDDKGQEQRHEQPFLMLSPTQHAPANGLSHRGHTHVRSRSLAAPSSAPVMARAHSSPGLDSRGRYVFPRSGPGKPSAVGVTPHELPLRRPSPLRTSFDGVGVGVGGQSLPSSSYGIAISEPILEQPELQASPVSYTSHPSQSTAGYTSHSSGSRPGSGRSVSPSWSPALHNTLPRVSRRRPSSPLLAHVPGQTSNGYTSNGHMPNGGMFWFYNNDRLDTFFDIFSFTPIPTYPARQVQRALSGIARLKAAADKADAAEAAGGFPHDLKRRSAVDMSSPSLGSRFGSGWADKRKRWSVCGAEGRQDLDLETIWED
ncbi:hypothetical protein MGYG_00026 [Nannizzia gypsea CBS 118893]|uniref:Uncharacterized protein n=1 Tax=Arthroderma gypseum (strain ATCC MYA-4604 / CBS 118893) TaxID=535722 RepID=E5R292_ARTGP|nr:hypothetical protein MGYG_00026 [Nannizzia gypsea CBS 118893]EFQ96982.1 hypothetical protein MGYG_00026 [Nannizzia gypsea CBS 118893]